MNSPKISFNKKSQAWTFIYFSEAFEFLNNKAISRGDLNYQEGAVKCIHYGDILTKFPQILYSYSPLLPYVNDDVDVENVSTLKTGDIVIADTAEDYAVGKSIEVSITDDSKVIAGLHTMPCRPKKNFASGFLGYYINSTAYHGQLRRLVTGTKVYSINKSEIRKTKLHFPCVEEQQKIAAFFTALDKKISLVEKSIAILESQKKELLRRIFCRELKLKDKDGNYYPEWKSAKLSELFYCIRNGFVGTIAPFYTDKENGVRYLQGTNIHNGNIDDSVEYYVSKEFNEKHSKNILKPTDLLVVQSGHVGDCAVVGNYAGANCHALIILSNSGKCSSGFVKYYFLSSVGKRNISLIETGNTIKHILASDLSKMTIPLPCLQEQADINQFFEFIDERLKIKNKYLKMLKLKKKGFMQQMFV